LEDLLPKDNEKISLAEFDLISPSELQPFSADQMVHCGTCSRRNPPTRINCLYCGAVLPTTETTAQLQKPALRRLEEWEHGFNIILIPTGHQLSSDRLAEISTFLKLITVDLERIFSKNLALPVARAASEVEADLITRRLAALGLATLTLPDAELISSESMVRVRSAELADDRLTSARVSGAATAEIVFSQIVLLVLGRLFVKRVEVKERKSRRSENELVNASEFFSDVAILDIHCERQNSSWRIEANNFDFSVLGSRKGLVAGENLQALITLIREQAPNAEFDDSYSSLRQALEPVWPSEQRTEAIGWQRQRPGKYSTSGAVESNNETQFTRYSCLRRYFKLNPAGPSR
jgi:hypothetical protein